MTDAEKKLAAIAKIVEGGTIEDVKAVLEDKPKKWVPKTGETYFWITGDRDIANEKWLSIRVDTERLKYNNCFRTEEEAIRVRDYRQRHGHKDSILSLMEEAARKDKEANPNTDADKYLFFHSHQNKWSVTIESRIHDPFNTIHFTTTKAAQAFIIKYEDELDVLKPEEN